MDYVLHYEPLAKAYSAPEQPLYSLQARESAWLEPSPHLSIPEMAREYIHAIRSVQQRGPYQLVGYSMGSSIAGEMATQVHAMLVRKSQCQAARC
ncbi:thioesterase domain-containing protein [Sinorhizobium psoraleae]|uniref:thioesterase domain-containing protein n=1 Tax=Sinorhizobium psoraleae TaxID=520838 RepID=UPI0035E3C82B